MDFNRYDKKKLLLLLVFSLILIQTVAAQNIADTFTNIPALQGLTVEKVVQLYDNFWWLWDFIVYALILSTALKLGAKNAGTFGESAGKIGGIFAVVLSIAAVFAEKQIGFNLKEFGPLALAIGIFAFGLYLWRTVKGLGLGERSRLILGILYITIYLLISPRLQGLRESIKSLGWIISIADILLFVFIIFIIIDLVSFIKGLRGGGGGNGPTPLASGPAPAVRQAEVDEGRRENIIAQEERRRQTEEQAEAADLGRIRDLDFRRDVGFRGVISALDNIIIPILEVRRFDEAGRATVLTKLNEITNFNREIARVQGSITANLRSLDDLERKEIAKLEQMASTAKGAIRDELVEKRNAKLKTGSATAKEIRALNSALYNLDDIELNWAKEQEKLIEAERKHSFAILAKTRQTLIAHEQEIRQLEGLYTQAYNDAIAALESGQIANPAVRLRDARNALARALEIDVYSERVDIPDLIRRVRQNYSQLGVENRLRRAIGVGMKRREALEQTAAKTSQQFIDTIRGIFRRR